MQVPKQVKIVPGAGRMKPTFKGPFIRWKLSYNINREMGYEDCFVVFSSGKRHVIHSYLWHKLVWDTLSKEEYSLLLSFPETLRNDKITGFIRSIQNIPKKVVRNRLNKLEQLLGQKVTSRECYQGYKRIRIEFYEERIKLSRTPKFSGYVRNISSLGKGSRGTGIPEPAPFVYEDEVVDTDWYYLLTVGEITLLSQVVILPEES